MERRDVTMFQDGRKAILGETTMDEVVRAALVHGTAEEPPIDVTASGRASSTSET